MARSSSSQRWLKRNFSDPYVKQAKQAGYRARSVYKLIELDKRFNILQTGHRVIDLGAAPGSWSQYATQKIGASGQLLAVDLLTIKPIHGIKIITGDYKANDVGQAISAYLKDGQADVILSDMAPNATGIKQVDKLQMSAMIDGVLEFVRDYLSVGGRCVYKTFQGVGFEDQVKVIGKNFKQVSIQKPSASRSQSSEVYVIAVGHKMK